MVEQQNNQQETPAPEKPQTIEERKAVVCKNLQKTFTNKLMNERLMKMAGGDASRIAKNLTAFLAVIMQDDGGSKDPNKKKYYCQCSISSLTACFLESMNMQLPFDSRKLVSMIIYDWEAELDISYKGFVNALNRHFTNAFVECKLVFEEDEFTADIDGRTANYRYKPADPFAVVTADFKGIKGGYCYFSYTDTDGKPTSRLVFLSRAQILKNKSRAKQQYVWDSDPKAMAEKTCIREGARLPFAAIDLDIDVEEIDNRHYRLEKPEGGDKLRLLMAAQEEVVHGKSTDNTAAMPASGAAEPSAAPTGQKAETQNASVVKPAGNNTPASVAGDIVQPADEPASGIQPAARRDNVPTGLSDEPPQALPITDADFEEMDS